MWSMCWVTNTYTLVDQAPFKSADMREGIRESLKGVLEDEGYSCEAVESGEAGLEELHRHTYDVVLLDVWMPGMDGLEALSRIQEIPAEQRPEVVVISGRDSPPLRHRLKALQVTRAQLGVSDKRQAGEQALADLGLTWSESQTLNFFKLPLSF